MSSAKKNLSQGEKRKTKIKGGCTMKVQKTDAYPFIIHGSLLEDVPQYPTHTHGLHQIGMPEFIIDPLSLGGDGNASVINDAYDYFKRPENTARMDQILNGATVRLKEKEFRPTSTGSYVFCFREVSPDFAAVKLAYPADDNIDSSIRDARIVQIYIEGDDYALTDDYYLGGVFW
jgi:hypothetical protein